jgi:hypothetical protein
MPTSDPKGPADAELRSGIDQALHLLTVAVDHLRARDFHTPGLTVGTSFNVGPVTLNLQVQLDPHVVSDEKPKAVPPFKDPAPIA